MAKSMTKSAIIAHLAQKTALSKKQVVELMDQLLTLATKEAKNVFVLPGLRAARARQPQGADGPQPADRRAHQDPGQARGEVPARQEPQGLGAWQEVTARRRSRTARSPRPGGGPRAVRLRRRVGSAAGRRSRRLGRLGRRASRRRPPARARGRHGHAPRTRGRRPRPHADPRRRWRIASDSSARPWPRRGCRASTPSSRARRASTASGCASASSQSRGRAARGAARPARASGCSAGAAAPRSGAWRARGRARRALARGATDPRRRRRHEARRPRRRNRRGQAPPWPGAARRPARAHRHRQHRRRHRALGPPHLPRSRHRLLHAGRPHRRAARAGASATRPSTPSSRSPASASRAGSTWAIATSPRICTAPACFARAARSPRSPARSPRPSACRPRVLPMSDQPVRTRILGPDGWLTFQEYFVRDKAQIDVRAVDYAGAAAAVPAPGVLEAIAAADAVIVCPSNPITSIGPDPRRAGHRRRPGRHAGASSSPSAPSSAARPSPAPPGGSWPSRGPAGLGGRRRPRLRALARPPGHRRAGPGAGGRAPRPLGVAPVAAPTP